MTKQRRTPVPIPVQVAVYFRDAWLCYICRRPLIFPFALKQLEAVAEKADPHLNPAYYNTNWRRDKAPLLDELGASVDHVEAFAAGGAHDESNFRAICARCNARKSTASQADFTKRSKPWKVNGLHGEPTKWDGLASVFVVLAGNPTAELTATERRWLTALQGYWAGGGV